MAWEWLEKYLKGTSGVPGSRVGEPYEKYTPDTQGLFGTGGNFGKGGLLTTFNQNPNAGNNMFEMLSNPAVGIGASIATRGMKGEDIGTAAFPSIKEGISFSESISKINTARKQREFIKKYESQVPPGDLALFKAFPEKYVSAMLQRDLKKDTLADAAKRIYDTVQSLPKGEQSDYINKLAKVERDLYNRYIKGEFNIFEYITGDEGNTMGLEIGKVITNEKGQRAKVIGFNPDGTPILEPVIE
jgi:hypothetical protein